jgi:hypothetical protein
MRLVNQLLRIIRQIIIPYFVVLLCTDHQQVIRILFFLNDIQQVSCKAVILKVIANGCIQVIRSRPLLDYFRQPGNDMQFLDIIGISQCQDMERSFVLQHDLFSKIVFFKHTYDGPGRKQDIGEILIHLA